MSVVIVTGASRGIGKAIVDVIVADKANKVVAVARSQDKLEQLQKQYPDQIAIVAGDVADNKTLKDAVKTAVDSYGKIDAVILNAGVIEPVGKIDEVAISAWKQHFDINFFSLVDLVKEAMPELKKSHGRIVAVSLGALTHHYSGWYAYGCGKAAVNHLIMLIADEEKDVTAISVAPGVVNTDMQIDIRTKCGDGMNPDVHKKFMDLHALNELVPPEEPGTVYAKLALNGWSDELNGGYWRYNDEKLAPFQRK